MTLTILPDDGLDPLLKAIARARRCLDIMIFRLDVKDVVDALEAAVKRGVAVRALIAHTNKGGEKSLRKLETRLLAIGVTVSRTGGDLVRYHGKLVIVDGKTLLLNGYNFTWLDIERSRSFGIATTSAPIVRDAQKLFQCDCDRQAYDAGVSRLVVSPANARERLAAFIKGARRELLIYDPTISDPRMLRLLAARKAAGVDVRIIGKVSPKSPLAAEKYPGKRLHVRAIIRDGAQAFLGSQSLRRLELDRRREVGLFIAERPVVRRMKAVFEADWAKTAAGVAAAADQEAPADRVSGRSTEEVLELATA